jgi:hypothetical protein
VRTLPANHLQQIQSAVQQPAYLIELYLPQGNAFFSTFGNATWRGKVYSAGGIKVSGIQTGQGATKQVSITISNSGFAWSQLFLAQTPSNSVVKIYKMLGSTPYQDSDAYLVFSGVVADVPDLVNFVTLNCVTANATTLTVPNITIGLPFFNFMPTDGQQIIWGGSKYVLRSR